MQYGNTLEGATLYVRQWQGRLSKDQSSYFPGKEPKMLLDTRYDFDRDKDNNICWQNRNDEKHYSSDKIVDQCLHWLVGQVAKKRLEKN